MEEGIDRNALHSQYRAFVQRELLPDAVRLAAFLFFTVSVAFVFVDWWLYPSLLSEFLPARVVTNLVLLVICIRTYRSHPLTSAFTASFVGGLMLLYVIHRTGGAHSDYYVGLVLLLMGFCVVLPFSVRQSLLVVGGLFGAHVGLSLFGVETFDERAGLQLVYLAVAGVVGTMSCVLFEHIRFREFCQRRELEEARDALAELDEAKSRFTANVHHELRTPLTLLLAPLEGMKAGDFGELPPSLSQTLHTMHANGLRLLRLINNLLDLAKIESRQLAVRRRPTELEGLVRGVVDGARPMVERKGLRIEIEGFTALPIVNVDPDAIEKIIVNLLGNALKFTERGHIELCAVSHREGVHFVVADTGIGIPPQKLEKVFDRFAQADSTATRRYEGTGIGLSLTKELVELHGGRIWAESEGAGRGTRMHVMLPWGEADMAAEEALLEGDERVLSVEKSLQAADASEEGKSGDQSRRFSELSRSVLGRKTKRSSGEDSCVPTDGGTTEDSEVLVVEDNPEMRQLLATLVGREFKVRTARHGQEALDEVRASPPTLVLTDVMMPILSGVEVCRILKDDTATSGIPVILVTSKAEREMKIEGLETGADDYVTKPFHPRELLARVRSLVRLRRLQEELEKRNATLAVRSSELKKALEDLKETEVQLVQAERLAAVGELSAGVAHEVNNPLNFARNAVGALRTYAEELIEVAGRVKELELDDPVRLRAQVDEWERQETQVELDRIGGDLRELVGIIGEGLDRTARLVGDLRDFAAPDRGPEVRIDIGAGLESTLELVGHRLRDAGARVTAEIEPGLPSVLGDPGAINQVFLNVLKNSADAIEGKGGGEIEVVARREGAEAVVRVRDDGPGVDSDVQARLFEPFFTTKSAGRGTGLGLSICRRIVEQHGGRIEVDSVPGAGATVVVRLPEGDSGAA